MGLHNSPFCSNLKLETFWNRTDIKVISSDYSSAHDYFSNKISETTFANLYRKCAFCLPLLSGTPMDRQHWRNHLQKQPCRSYNLYNCSICCLLFFHKYVANTLLQLMEKSTKSCVLLGAVPLFYYLFDYITTIYTDLLYQGVSGAVQFMPSVFSIVYFVFIIIYYAEMQKQAFAHRERDMLAAQLRGAHSELATLRQMQNMAAAYRHDMRHHFAILHSMASEGSIEKIKTYLNTARSDIDEITPLRFCENETVNLILSTFMAKAKNAGVNMNVEAKLPGLIPLNDTELCSLLSNGLENAIFAAGSCLDPERRTVTAKATIHKGNLLILIENPYDGVVVFEGGLPQSSQKDHGFGTRSIAAIAEAHRGQAIFNAEDGVFTMKIMISLRKLDV